MRFRINLPGLHSSRRCRSRMRSLGLLWRSISPRTTATRQVLSFRQEMMGSPGGGVGTGGGGGGAWLFPHALASQGQQHAIGLRLKPHIIHQRAQADQAQPARVERIFLPAAAGAGACRCPNHESPAKRIVGKIGVDVHPSAGLISISMPHDIGHRLVDHQSDFPRRLGVESDGVAERLDTPAHCR